MKSLVWRTCMVAGNVSLSLDAGRVVDDAGAEAHKRFHENHCLVVAKEMRKVKEKKEIVGRVGDGENKKEVKVKMNETERVKGW
ncbi:hypothetical protein RIF29_11663 [Crotalaria pallida]|uniref:Uncharacterized protein n=1 Tax=Crotalaria pallida TaxID=3830 RepID=A0AAN9IMB9_CROPI